MKKFLSFFFVIAVTVVLTLAFSAAVLQPKAVAAPGAAAAAPAASAEASPMPPHPHIDEALEAMRNAKHHLETAEHDFHGHRVAAIKHLDSAIHEAEICAAEP